MTYIVGQRKTQIVKIKKKNIFKMKYAHKFIKVLFWFAKLNFFLFQKNLLLTITTYKKA